MKRQRQFTLEDQVVFANLSGDFNPVHVDRIAARRYMFGQPVVHGVHTLLWALDNWCQDRDAAIKLRSVKAEFVKPIVLGELVTCQLVSEQSDGCEIHVRSGVTVFTKIVVAMEHMAAKALDGGRNTGIIDAFPVRRSPRVLLQAELDGLRGSMDLYLETTEAARLFPNLVKAVPAFQIAIILNTSRLVGVECPGLHSLYSSLELAFEDSAEPAVALNYVVSKLDRRFNLAQLNLDAPGATGRIRAFLRPAPVEQPSCASLQIFVEANEFAGQTALVVGGSRGLGEVVAKLLTAGGATVRITYYEGESDARHIVDDIIANGGHADCAPLNVLDPIHDLAAISQDGWLATHCYYFATPFIFSGMRGVFSAELFRRFCAYYVTGFLGVVDYWCTLGVKCFFYPSTVAIDELPLNMGEYTAAKAAGEKLCEFLGRTHPTLNIYRPRLPRAATDQTVSVVPVGNQDPVALMLNELRVFRTASAKQS